MNLLHESGTPLVLIGYVLCPKDIDSFMWNDFEEFERCSECNLRLQYSGVNPSYRPPRTAPDYGNTWDGELIVSNRFRAVCKELGLEGIEYMPLVKTSDYFHARFSKSIPINQAISKPIRRGSVCSKCGQSDGLHWDGPRTFDVTSPLPRGFFRSDVIVGWGNRKGPFEIVSPVTRRELEESGLTGFHSFDPVYAVSTPELESALATYPALKPAKVKRVAKPRPPACALGYSSVRAVVGGPGTRL